MSVEESLKKKQKKTLHHANDLAPGSYSSCQESPFQFEWIWIKRISHKGQVWPKQHFVCKSTGSQSSGLFLPLSCCHYRGPMCPRRLSVKLYATFYLTSISVKHTVGLQTQTEKLTHTRSHKLWHEHIVWSYYFPECVIPFFLMVPSDLWAHTIHCHFYWL